MRSVSWLVTGILALAFVAQGCVSPGPSPAELIYAPELHVDLGQMTLTPEGLYLQDLAVGVGDEVRKNDGVTIHYNGWFVDGELFESSQALGDPISFIVGSGRVIDGWELGLLGMREGGIRRLVVPSGLAYGYRGVPGSIPGNATLVFEVQLLRIGPRGGR